MVEPTKLRRFFLVAVCASILFLCIVYVIVGDNTVWGAWIAMALPVLVAALLVPTILRLRSWIAAALLIAFFAAATEWPRFESEIGTSQTTLRLVSWNKLAPATSRGRAPSSRWTPTSFSHRKARDPLACGKGSLGPAHRTRVYSPTFL